MRTVRCLLLLLLACIVLGDEALDYEEREPGPRFVDATSDVNVRRDPAARSPRVALLHAGDRAVILGRAFGWIRIRTESGEKGWVDRRFLREEAPPVTAFGVTTRKPPCHANLGDCPPVGCAAEESEQLRNAIKRNASPSGPATRLTLASFRTLQNAAMRKVGDDAGELDVDDRALLTGLRVAGKRLGEGSRIVVTGYVVGHPRANTGESVNCRLGTEANNDYHVAIAARPATADAKRDEFRSIVVELIPQHRPAGWTDEKLEEVRDRKRMVMVEGQLFYDDLHKVNGNPDAPVGRQPPRFSLWEIHPVTDFWVCEDARCDPAADDQWTALDDWEP